MLMKKKNRQVTLVPLLFGATVCTCLICSAGREDQSGHETCNSGANLKALSVGDAFVQTKANRVFASAPEEEQKAENEEESLLRLEDMSLASPLYISPAGNDATGDGSRNKAYRTLKGVLRDHAGVFF
jgi:hypothetical protein